MYWHELIYSSPFETKHHCCDCRCTCTCAGLRRHACVAPALLSVASMVHNGSHQACARRRIMSLCAGRETGYTWGHPARRTSMLICTLCELELLASEICGRQLCIERRGIQ